MKGDFFGDIRTNLVALLMLGTLCFINPIVSYQSKERIPSEIIKGTVEKIYRSEDNYFLHVRIGSDRNVVVFYDNNSSKGLNKLLAPGDTTAFKVERKSYGQIYRGLEERLPEDDKLTSH